MEKKRRNIERKEKKCRKNILGSESEEKEAEMQKED